MRRIVALSRPLDLATTLAPLQTGRHDPTMRMAGATVARASRNADGPVTLRLDVDASSRRLTAVAVGPGAARALDEVTALVGEDDEVGGFDPGPEGPVARFARRLPGLRLLRTGRVADVLLPTVLAQKVTGLEAVRSYAALARTAGEPAPPDSRVPALLLPPTPEWLARAAGWQFTAAGVDRSRARAIVASSRRMARLEEATAMPPDRAHQRLVAIPGIGPWTAAIVRRLAMGDPDAVELGDFHLPNTVAWNLAREPRADDRRMLELLAPFAGHRGRVVRLCEVAGQRAPARGPRLAPRRFGART